MDLATEPLLPREAFDQLLAEAMARANALEPGPSTYHTLVQLADIYHELGNRLSGIVYGTKLEGEFQLGCAAGCDTCCHIPSEVRPGDNRNFSMSYLDVIWLVANYDRIKAANPEVNLKARAAFDGAQSARAVPPCPHLSEEGSCRIYEQRPMSCKIWFSADLSLCIINRQRGYAAEVNPLTDRSKSVLTAFSEPFAAHLERLDPGRDFWDYDFLTIFSQIAQLDEHRLFDTFRELDEHRLFDTFREKIDAGELSSWEPFD